jgi:hypothetical protein
MDRVVYFHSIYKKNIRWSFITFFMLFLAVMMWQSSSQTFFDKSPNLSLAQEWESGEESTFESGSQPIENPAVEQPVWESGVESTYESNAQPVQDSVVPAQPQWENGYESTFDFTPQITPPPPPIAQTITEEYPNSPLPIPTPVYQQPQYESPIQNNQPQVVNQPNTQATNMLPASQPSIVPTALIPTTAEEYQCEGGNKVFYRVYINVAKAPERTGRIDYNSPTCTSPVYTSFQGSADNQRSDSQFQHTPLSASCQASPSLARVGEGVTWQVIVSGGSGNFKYDFSGDLKGQSSNGSSIYIPGYSESGRKQVEIKVIDQTTNQKVTASCETLIIAQPVFSPIPTIQPVPQPVIAQTTNPIYIPNTTVQMVNSQAQCPFGTFEKSRTMTNLVCERQAPTVSTINTVNQVQCPAGTVEKNRSNGILQCEQTSPSTVVVSTPTPQPVQIVTTSAIQTPVQCPSGTIEKSRNNTQLICERQVAQTQQQSKTVQSSAFPESVKILGSQSSSIKELPKTGLPLAAVSLTALTPLGLRLRRFMKLTVLEESANEIWIRRQIRS